MLFRTPQPAWLPVTMAGAPRRRTLSAVDSFMLQGYNLMKTIVLARLAVSAGVAGALLAGCGGSQPLISPPELVSHSLAESEQHAHAIPLLYVANFDPDYNDVTVYHAKAKNPSPIRVISNGLDNPTDDCLDSEGTLYVVNEPAAAGWVSEYLADKTKPAKVITKGINTPAFCAIDGSGNLWVTNIGGSNVTEYERGSTKPHTVITNGIFYPVGIAIDDSGNMYVANRFTKSSGPANVVVYSAGSKSPSRTIKDGVVSPVGIAIGPDGTLYVTNITENNVEEYRFGQSQPYQTITDSMSEPTAATVNGSGYLYVTNFGNDLVVEFPPGSTTPSRREISNGLHSPEGTAYSPPLLP
jgi:sugar lactone lactonase YvrE